MASPDRPAIGLVLAALPLRVLLALTTDLSPDEAYYLAAARLDLPLADHPPLIRWLLAVADSLAALPLELRTRLPCLLLGTAFAWLVVEFVRHRDGSGLVQRWAALFSAWYILPIAGGFIMTPDSVLLCAVVAFLLLAAPPPRSRMPCVALIASVCFIGMLAKVTMFVVVLPFILIDKRLLERIAAAAGTLAALPLALPSLVFQVDHAFVDRHHAVGCLAAITAALTAQLALWGPAVLFLGLRRVVDHHFDRLLVAVMMGLVILSAGLRGVPPEPNWFAPGAMVLAAAASHAMPRASTWLRITAVLFGPTAVLVLSTHVIHPWIPIPKGADPSARLHGWSDGAPPEHAPGVGPYGPAAEACIYFHKCEEILKKANTYQQGLKQNSNPTSRTPMN